jgi:UDP-glucose 4-epimerase
VEGETRVATYDDYTSHNTERLNVGQVKSLISKLDFIKGALNA